MEMASAEEGGVGASFALLSEAAWGLDRSRQERLFARLLKMKGEGKGILAFFAGTDYIRGLCDEVIDLREGKAGV